MDPLMDGEVPASRAHDYLVCTAAGVFLVARSLIDQADSFSVLRVLTVCEDALTLAAHGDGPGPEGTFGEGWRLDLEMNTELLREYAAEQIEEEAGLALEGRVVRGVLVHNLAAFASARRQAPLTADAERHGAGAAAGTMGGAAVEDRTSAEAASEAAEGPRGREGKAASVGPLIGIRQPDGSVLWLPPGSATPAGIAAPRRPRHRRRR